MDDYWLPLLMAFLGALHAAAAYFYFSKEGQAWPWTIAWLVFTALCLVLLGPAPHGALLLFLAAILGWTLWWDSIRAEIARGWVVENARQCTAEVVDEDLVVRDVRNFEWLGGRDCVPCWEVRRYPLGHLIAIDLFASTWGNPRVAHLIVSFVFSDLPPLAFSIETRREARERWSILAGFMKSYELILIAADERDVVRVRTNVRGEQVARYRLKTTPQMRRNLLARYVEQMNSLARRPRFYNTLLRNCTTEVVRILRAAGRPVPLDWRILVSGYVPQYLHELGMLEDHRPFAEVMAAANIDAVAHAADDSVDRSRGRIGRAFRTRPEWSDMPLGRAGRSGLGRERGGSAAEARTPDLRACASKR